MVVILICDYEVPEVWRVLESWNDLTKIALLVNRTRNWEQNQMCSWLLGLFPSVPTIYSSFLVLYLFLYDLQEDMRDHCIGNTSRKNVSIQHFWELTQLVLWAGRQRVAPGVFQEPCIAHRKPLSQPHKMVVGNKWDNGCKVPGTWEAQGSISGSY